MKILIVDDSNIMCKTISKVVMSSGFKPLIAENGAEALVRLRKNESDIALINMDWNMPIMNGYEALVKIRSNEQFNKIPILMATSDGIDDDVVKAIKAGANGYMVKPFKSEELSNKISEILNL